MGFDLATQPRRFEKAWLLMSGRMDSTARRVNVSVHALRISLSPSVAVGLALWIAVGKCIGQHLL
jgi:hypothetical protein